MERLPNGGTRVVYNGKVFTLKGHVIRAHELAKWAEDPANATEYVKTSSVALT